MSEMPLHVKVAEALGARERLEQNGTYTLVVQGGTNQIGFVEAGDCWRACPRYDTDWSVTGPLIERFKIKLEWYPDCSSWMAFPKIGGGGWTSGPTPLIAVCLCILDNPHIVKEAGKLEPETTKV